MTEKKAGATKEAVFELIENSQLSEDGKKILRRVYMHKIFHDNEAVTWKTALMISSFALVHLSREDCRHWVKFADTLEKKALSS